MRPIKPSRSIANRSWPSRIAIESLPTAEATRFIAPPRTSPTGPDLVWKPVGTTADHEEERVQPGNSSKADASFAPRVSRSSFSKFSRTSDFSPTEKFGPVIEHITSAAGASDPSPLAPTP